MPCMSAWTRIKRHPWRWLAVLAGTAAFTALLIWGPWWIEGHHLRDDKGQLVSSAGIIITGFRTMLVALAAGGFTAAGLWYTREKHRLERDQFQHAQQQFETTISEAQSRDEKQAELTREGQVTGRYVEAIKLLASDNLHERLGGIYALERVMIDSGKDHETIVEVLAAFIRTGPVRGADDPSEPTVDSSRGETPSEDQLAACAVLGRRPSRSERRSVNLSGANLTRADFAMSSLPKADLGSVRGRSVVFLEAELDGLQADSSSFVGASFAGATLARASFADSQLGHASFAGSQLTDAWLADARCHRANFSGTDLGGAYLRRIKACHCKFTNADLSGAVLAGGDLKGSDFANAVFRRVDLEDVNLQYADLSEAIGLQVVQVCQARIYTSTRLPHELAAHPWVKARIEQCEEARKREEEPGSWEKPQEPPLQS